MKPVSPDGLHATITTLCGEAGLPEPLVREPIRIWPLSAVERVRFPDRTTAICKHARPPFTGEATVLQAAARAGLPVPRLLAHRVTDDRLVMLLEDLGDSTETPTDLHAAAATARLHRADPTCPSLDVWDTDTLAALPETMLDAIGRLSRSGQLRAGKDILLSLAGLARSSTRRAEGTQRPPFGLVHGEFHPTSLHRGMRGQHLIDFGMTFIGPGILDLATWQGTRQPPDPKRLAAQLHAYVTAGGTTQILRQRGGLAPEVWALGWHRLHSAAWLLQLTATGSDGFDPSTTKQILRRQISTAIDLLR
ncbi:phosphotransferase family enzyme [Paractinoplanes brasiliensis]|uniref:Phosphotransferase family enzyme n=1 Tax=Paractinoplanes brasiliensis TaxID=52695 RepID=A0A4V3C7U6_9ACTN|nr:aminoglycoside phosphotransferase family protein [Actinoplanes brasiliensis]TDO39008.1 phosphotransferase family enzyme [Actinoplanes brasiliensis]